MVTPPNLIFMITLVSWGLLLKIENTLWNPNTFKDKKYQFSVLPDNYDLAKCEKLHKDFLPELIKFFNDW